MTDKKQVPAPDLSVGADKEQTPSTDTKIITTQRAGFNNDFYAGLSTFTLDEALDSYFEPKEPVIENLLNPGTYIMAGASKITVTNRHRKECYEKHTDTGRIIYGLI